MRAGATWSAGERAPWEPAPYPYDRLRDLHALASRHPGGAVDLSIGTPCDPPPDVAVAALGRSVTLRGYPPSAGTDGFRDAARAWMERRFSVEVPRAALGACVGTKELVTGLPSMLRLRAPDRDTVFYPEVSYPSYAMGAELAGCRAYPVPVDGDGHLDLATIDAADRARGLVLWANSPSNPTGKLDDLGAAARWGRENGVLVASDECYVELTWHGRGRSILEHGRSGVVAVHSLSKRSNFAGARAGFYAGDDEVVGFLVDVRRHAGLMVPGPIQDAAQAALGDDGHVDEQRQRYRQRLERFAGVLASTGSAVRLPGGTFYLWAPTPERFADDWAFARWLAENGGVVVSPGDLYGKAGAGHVRVALVQPLDRLALVAERLGAPWEVAKTGSSGVA